MLYHSADSSVIKATLFHYVFFWGFLSSWEIFDLLTFLYPHRNPSLQSILLCADAFLILFESFLFDIVSPLISSLKTNFDRLPKRLVNQIWLWFWLQFFLSLPDRSQEPNGRCCIQHSCCCPCAWLDPKLQAELLSMK